MSAFNQRFGLLALVLTALLGGCGGVASVPSPAPAVPAASLAAPEASSSRPDDSALDAFDVGAPDLFADAPDATLAGTYKGTFVEKGGGATISGTLVITLKISGTAVSGGYVLTRDGKSTKIAYSGTGHHTKHGFKMSLVAVASDGCKGTGPATIANRKFTGSYVAPACDGAPTTTYTYKALKAATE
jgi:hypothetical protein